jgi:hypothetical protein
LVEHVVVVDPADQEHAGGDEFHNPVVVRLRESRTISWPPRSFDAGAVAASWAMEISVRRNRSATGLAVDHDHRLRVIGRAAQRRD